MASSVVLCKMCKATRLSQLLLTMIHESLVNPVTNPVPVFIHSLHVTKRSLGHILLKWPTELVGMSRTCSRDERSRLTISASTQEAKCLIGDWCIRRVILKRNVNWVGCKLA